MRCKPRRFPVGEREIGQHSDPRWRGKNWQPLPAILGTATWTPGKSSLFLLMGMQDHGFESIDLRWFSHPVQQRLPALWVEIHVVHGKPRGAPRPVACPYQEPQQVSWAKSLWSMEQCSQGKSAKWRCNLGRSLGSKGWLTASGAAAHVTGRSASSRMLSGLAVCTRRSVWV